MFIPYAYQQECVDAIEARRQNGFKKALVVMATGLGKTVTVAFHAKKWLQKGTGKRFLYLCHQNDILYQAKSTFEAVLGHQHSYGYFHGREKSVHAKDFLFASLQTMELHRHLFDPKEFGYILVDESHHSQAPTFRSVIEYFKPEFLLGVTATPDRLDKENIREIFGEEVYSLPLEEALAKGYLSPVDYRLMTDEIQLSGEIWTEKGKVSISRLNREIFIPRRDEEIARIIKENLSEVKNPRTIIFCSSVKHCEHMAQFVENSFPIHSRIPEREREVRLEMFRHGLITTVLTVDCFNEGIDIPEANVVVFLRSTDSDTIFFQQLGRGLRRDEGKDKVVVLDFVANCERIKTVVELKQSVEQELDGLRKQRGEKGEVLYEPMMLNVGSVEFQEKIVPILEVLARASAEFYPTWQEASEAAAMLGIRSAREYGQRYRQDLRLPSFPYKYYMDFPGWPEFLKKEFYPTWEEAGKAAKALGIKTSLEYAKKYKEDRNLPSMPRYQYSDFPGWRRFFGCKEKDFYLNCQSASEAAISLGIRSSTEYTKNYKKDPKLPAAPDLFYKDFPGWPAFIGNEIEIRNFYPTWEEAGRAAASLGITSFRQYRVLYRSDMRLPSDPRAFFCDFPGWKKFLSKD